MSGFIGDMINQFTHSGGSGQSHSNPQQPPQVPPPWVARWDEPAGCWIFINEQNGERTFEFPGGYGAGGGYGGGGYQRQEYVSGGAGPGGGYYEERREERGSGGGHGMAYGALGAAAGVAAGAGLMYEGEKVHEDWDRDKYRLEGDVDEGVQDVADFPEDAARWTGRKVSILGIP